MSEGRYLTFRSGAETMALKAEDVLEIVRPPRVTRVPHAPDCLHGIANLRGSVLPIVALDRLLGREPAAETRDSRVLVLNRAAPLGLLVDAVANLGEKSRHTGTLDVDAALGKRLTFAARAKTAAPDRKEDQTDNQAAGEAGGGTVTLISFLIAGQSYALSLTHVREVISLPSDSAISPGAGTLSLGVMIWRDVLLPLISLRAVLDRPALEDRTRARVVITRTDLGLIGLVTDGLCEILRLSPAAIDKVPAALARSHGRTEIEAIARLDGGRRLVSILAAEAFFTARYLGETAWDTGPQQDHQIMGNMAASGQKEEQVVVFALGEEQYGLPIAAVEEVVRLPETLTRLPRAPDFIDGVMNLRGKVLPIIDQARRFGVPASSQARRRRAVVVSLDGVQVGFVVDAVLEIMNVSATDVSPVPDLSDDGTKLFDRAVHRPGGESVILLVDPKELLDRTERDLLASLRQSSSETD